jgi:hypothetical protein
MATTTAQVEKLAGKRQVQVEEQISYKKLTESNNAASRLQPWQAPRRHDSHWFALAILLPH